MCGDHSEQDSTARHRGPPEVPSLFFNLPTHVWVGLNSLRFFDSDNTETALLALKKLAALFEFRNQLAGEERAYPFAAPALEFEAVNIGTSNYQIVTVGPPP